MSTSLEQLARNQSLFREVNERIREVMDSWDGASVDFLCECSQQDCTEIVALDRQEYESVRSHPNRFAVVPGHEILEVERVVDQNERFAVVEKTVEVGFTIRHDPRSRDGRD